MFAARQHDNLTPLLMFVGFVVILVILGRRKHAGGSAFGTAAWCSDRVLRAWKMLGKKGLVLGHTAAGELIRMPTYVHCLLCGGTGSGKGVSIICTNLIDYSSGGLVVFDPKGDLFETALKHRKCKGKMIRFAPFNGGEDYFNPLDTIPTDSPLLIDSARAMAEALVVRQG